MTQHSVIHAFRNKLSISETKVTTALVQYIVNPGGGGTPYDDQCTMLGGLDPHFRAWLDPIGSIFEPGSIP